MRQSNTYSLFGLTMGMVLFFLSFEGNAQSHSDYLQIEKNHSKFEANSHLQRKNKSQQKPTGSQSRMIATTNRYYVSGNPKTTQDSIHYYFSGNEHFDETREILSDIARGLPRELIRGDWFDDRPDSTFFYGADGIAFTNLHEKRVYNMDAQGRISTRQVYAKDSSATVWDNSRKSDYTYDGSNEHPDTIVHQDWDGSNWENQERDTYSYDSISGNQMSVTYEYWDDSLSIWDKSRQYLSAYDSRNNEILYTKQLWRSGWVNQNRRASVYNTTKNLTERQNLDWDVTALDWELKDRRSYTYNSMNLQTELLVETLNTATDSMENHNRELITYDANDVPLDLTRQDWVSSSWENDEKDIYTFDSEGMLVKITTQAWSSGSWENDRQSTLKYNSFNQITEGKFAKWSNNDTWEDTWRSNYYYETFDDGETGLDELELASEVTVYPNPANQQLNLRLKEGYVEFIRIFDMSGRIVFESKTKLKGNEIIIPLGQLSTGTYILQVKIDRTIINKHFVVQY